MVNKARAKVEAEKLQGTQAELQQMVLCWLEADAGAAERILQEGKTVQGAYAALEQAAKAKKESGAVCMAPPEAMAVVMEYYGMAKEDIQSELEGGLMYRIIMAYSSTWKPYGAEVPKAQPDADTEQETVSEPASKPAPAPAKEKPKKFSLASFSLEDEL